MPPTQPVSYGRRIADIAATHPEETAIVVVAADGSETEISWGNLDAESNRMARLMAERGIDETSLVVVALPTCIEHFLTIIGSWRLGATVLPLNSTLPAHELGQMLEVAGEWRPAAIVGDVAGPHRPLIRRDELHQRAGFDAGPLPDKIAQPGRALASGGSTGRPKLILDPKPWVRDPDRHGFIDGYGLAPRDSALIMTRLYHAIGFNSWNGFLNDDIKVIAMERFTAPLAVDLIEKHRVAFLGIVPTIMQRILQVPNVTERDFSSIKAMYHSGGPCAPWLKRAWTDVVPPERTYDLYGGAEGTGLTRISTAEWLDHPGSVGRGFDCDLKILDEAGNELPAGDVGEIYMRRWISQEPNYQYLGASPAKSTADGFTSIGDLGWLDEDGYLYLADRRADLIISGDANVYPAEVEAALSEHVEVDDVAVIGLPDPRWGKRVHAVIQARDPELPPAIEDLDRFVRERLQAYKIPKTYEFTPKLPRDENGKIRRSSLIDTAS